MKEMKMDSQKTYGDITLDSGTVDANRLKNLFDFPHETNVIDWFCQFNVTKMTWTVGHIFTTGGTFQVAINGTQKWIQQPMSLWDAIFKSFRIFDFRHGHCFLYK
jgi:hypothetical protein